MPAAVRGQGWRDEVSSGADRSGYGTSASWGASRRARTVEEAAIAKVAEAAEVGATLGQLEAAVALDGPTARAAVLALLWSGRWSWTSATDVLRRAFG